MDLIRSSLTVLSTQLFHLLRSKRFVICSLLVMLPIGISVLPRIFADPAEDFPVGPATWLMIIQGMTPLLALIFGSAVISEEVSDRTITYLFTRPIPRAAVFFGRWLASFLIVTVLLSISVVGTISILGTHFQCDDPFGMAWSLILVAALGTAVYSSVFAALGALIKHPMIVGLGYVFAFELLLVLSSVPGSLQHLALQFHLRCFIIGTGVSDWQSANWPGMNNDVTQGEAMTTIIVALVVALSFGSWLVSRRQYELSA